MGKVTNDRNGAREEDVVREGSMGRVVREKKMRRGVITGRRIRGWRWMGK